MEAITIINQLATGQVLTDNGDYLFLDEPFETPAALRNLGLLPLKEILIKNSESNNKISRIKLRNLVASSTSSKISLDTSTNFNKPGPDSYRGVGSPRLDKKVVRLWLVVEDIYFQKYQELGGDYYFITDVKLALEPRKVMTNSRGVIEETQFDDPHDPAVQFAKIFTYHFDAVSHIYPIFKRVKQVVRALAMADWVRK